MCRIPSSTSLRDRCARISISEVSAVAAGPAVQAHERGGPFAMARRGRRDLSLEEKRLWEHVARHVTPLARPGIPIETPDSRMGHRAREQAGEKAAEKAGEGDMPKNRLRNDVSLPAMGRGGGAPTAPQSRPAKPEEKQRAHPRPSPARPALPAYHPPLSHKQNAAPSGPGGLDRKERRALRRRVREIEATLDLHGMRQERSASRPDPLPPGLQRARLCHRAGGDRQGRGLRSGFR